MMFRFWWQLFSKGRLQFNLSCWIIKTRACRSILATSY